MGTAFSEHMKELRNNMHMNQAEFSKLIGTNQSTLSAYENGDRFPPYEMLICISQQCHISIDWLCGLSNQKNGNGQYTTYYDVLSIFVKLCSTKYDDGEHNLVTPSIINSSSNIHFIVRDDLVFNSFFENWQKMYTLLQDSVINTNIYNQWLEGELSKYKTHPINRIPF